MKKILIGIIINKENLAEEVRDKIEVEERCLINRGSKLNKEDIKDIKKRKITKIMVNTGRAKDMRPKDMGLTVILKTRKMIVISMKILN
jgi:hypothetical protein